jgi:crotonobetainyl-CoA:carnitine CoA-transferase CaiB-like acyl-CoA transferase
MRVWGRGEHVWWEVIARNKKSVSINLRVPEGQALARRPMGQADILIENFRPGALEGWGLDPEDLLAENPGLIMVRMSGYGQDGPYAGRTGFGGVGEAMGGWRAIVGDPDRPPSRMGLSIGDSLAATYGCLGAMMALHHREKTGQGQIVDSALYESVLQVMENLVPEYSVAGIVRERSGSILPGIALSNVYRCKDGDYMIGANNNAIFARLRQAMGRPELAKDPRYATHGARGERQTELDQLIEGWTGALTIDEVEALMLEHSIPAGRTYHAPDMIADPHFAAREAIVEAPNPRWKGLMMQNVFPKLSETPGAIRSIAPQTVGQDNAAALSGLLGLGEADLAALSGRGVI